MDPSAPPSYGQSLDEDKTPVEKSVFAQQQFNGFVGFTQCAANQYGVYLLRSDGIVDRSTGSGRVCEHMRVPEEEKGVTYTCPSSSEHTYLLRSDGAVARTSSGKIKTIINPRPGIPYIGCSAGFNASYLIRADGKIDRTVSKGTIEREMQPEGFPTVTYISASSGYEATYLVRSDGAVDRVKSGKVEMTMNPPPAKKYVYVGDQIDWTQSNGQSTQQVGCYANYLLRSDGCVDRTHSGGVVDNTYSCEAGITYVDCSAGSDSSYLVRSDGVVERITGRDGKTVQVISPADTSFKYVGVSAGSECAYFVRSDGKVDRSSRGKITHTINADDPNAPLQPRTCCVIC